MMPPALNSTVQSAHSVSYVGIRETNDCRGEGMRNNMWEICVCVCVCVWTFPFVWANVCVFVCPSCNQHAVEETNSAKCWDVIKLSSVCVCVCVCVCWVSALVQLCQHLQLLLSCLCEFTEQQNIGCVCVCECVCVDVRARQHTTTKPGRSLSQSSVVFFRSCWLFSVLSLMNFAFLKLLFSYSWFFKRSAVCSAVCNAAAFVLGQFAEVGLHLKFYCWYTESERFQSFSYPSCELWVVRIRNRFISKFSHTKNVSCCFGAWWSQ